MADIALPRRLDTEAAIRRLGRLGAHAVEPARLRLWACAVSSQSDQASSAEAKPAKPAAWLLCHREAGRALLWPGALPDAFASAAGDELVLAGSAAPEPGAVSRLWFWERLGKLRRWRAQVQADAPRAVMLPLWLGYVHGRGATQRLIVISGISGEVLSALKPAVLGELACLASVKPKGTRDAGCRAVPNAGSMPG